MDKRDQLIRQYELLDKHEDELDELVFKGLRPKNIFYEVDKVHFQYAKDKIVVSLIGTQKPYFEEIKALSEQIYENLMSKVKNGESVSFEEKIEFAEERKETFARLNERILSVLNSLDSDLYEMGLLVQEIDNIICLKDESALNEALTNYRILRNVAKIYSFEEENELFKTTKQVIENLQAKLESSIGSQLGE